MSMMHHITHEYDATGGKQLAPCSMDLGGHLFTSNPMSWHSSPLITIHEEFAVHKNRQMHGGEALYECCKCPGHIQSHLL